MILTCTLIMSTHWTKWRKCTTICFGECRHKNCRPMHEGPQLWPCPEEEVPKVVQSHQELKLKWISIKKV